MPKNDVGQPINSGKTDVCKRRPLFRSLKNLSDLRRLQAKLLRMFLNEEIDERVYRACVYGTATLCQTMRAIKEPSTDTPPEYNLFGRFDLGGVYLGCGNDDEQVAEQEATEAP